MSEVLKTQEELENDYAFIFPNINDFADPEWKSDNDFFEIFSSFDESYKSVPTLSTMNNTTSLT